ncbi:uncharacterized protein LOC123530731 [Mercenaria mercenaria]|uniref:uncharacterized protein LOC123530731 n=1 Tax=Mercenaria mercenaria TaxID=6596 RepID=UPI001E1D90D1|nr:uncharacterized protein LOC123530731 [Mercenaria mercenaria]
MADKMQEESAALEDTIKVIPAVDQPSEKPLQNVIDISDTALAEMSQNKVTGASENTMSVENVITNNIEHQVKVSNSEIFNRTKLPHKSLSDVNQAPSQMLARLAAELQKATSYMLQGASSVAEVAHNAFLASQPGPHLILQQIQDMSQKYGNQDVVLVSDKELSAPVAPVDEELG